MAFVGLQLSFRRGSNLRKASGIVHKAASSANVKGWTWGDRTLHEHEVAEIFISNALFMTALFSLVFHAPKVLTGYR